MEYRRLGNSGLMVSVLSLGTMTFGGAGAFGKLGAVDVQGARRQIDICLDAGVNLVDTSDVYSAGLSEEILGEALRGRRDRLLVATKARFPTGLGPNDAGLSRHHLIEACDQSLKRLGTDHIDLYQVHMWDGQTPVEETLTALDMLVQAGKVRYIGCSNFSAWHVMKSLGRSTQLGLTSYVSMQIHYTLEAREVEYELVPIALDQGLGILVWSPLAGGLLSGKYRRSKTPEGESRQLNGWNEPPIRDENRLYDIVDAIIEVSERHGVPPAQVAIAWVMGRPAVASVIIGARTEDQLVQDLGAARLPLTDEDRARLDNVSAPPLLYPYWHQLTASDRLSAADLSLLKTHLVRPD